MSSNFSQVCFKLCLPVNLRPKPFSPSRQSVSLSISILTMYIFPVVLSLNLSPIFIVTPSPFSTSGRVLQFEAKNSQLAEKIAPRCSTSFSDHSKARFTANPKLALRAQTLDSYAFLSLRMVSRKNLNSRAELLFPLFQHPISLLTPERPVLPFFPDQLGRA